jgi:Tfp pilus assembly protein PilF
MWLLLTVLSALPAWGARPVPASAADGMAMLQRMDTARVQGSPSTLRTELDAREAKAPKDPMPRVYRAFLALPSEESFSEFKALAVVFPENPWPHVGMGLVYVKWGMLKEAAPPLEAARKAVPGFAPALWADGLRLQAEGKPAEAEGRLREALAKLDVPRLRTDLALLLAGRPGGTDEARALLVRSVKDWPEQPDALQVLSRLAREAGDAKAGAEAGALLVALQPHDREAHRRQADAWLAAGDSAQAARMLERYAALGGAEPSALATWVRLNVELNRPEDEAKALVRLAAATPKDPEPLLRLATLAEAKADLPEVEARLGQAVALSPERADIQARWARWLLKQERYFEAVAAYRATLAAPQRPVPEAAEEAAALNKKLRLPASPAKGTLENIYDRVSLGLVALYLEHLMEKPELKGNLKVRVELDATGKAQKVVVLYDSLQDVLITHHAHVAFMDAQYPPGSESPVYQYVFRPPR